MGTALTLASAALGGRLVGTGEGHAEVMVRAPKIEPPDIGSQTYDIVLPFSLIAPSLLSSTMARDLSDNEDICAWIYKSSCHGNTGMMPPFS